MLLVISFFIIFITSSSPLPLRPVGVEKHIKKAVGDNRELILCWVVQIRTNSKCGCSLTEGELMQDVNGCCLDGKQMAEHAAALAEEVGLKIHHSFSHFPDHFVLCHTPEISRAETEAKHPSQMKSTSETLAHLHQHHLTWKLKNKNEFERYQTAVENKLEQHGEVVWFSVEHIHRRHPRSFVPPHLEVNKLLQVNNPTDKILDTTSDKTSFKWTVQSRASSIEDIQSTIVKMLPSPSEILLNTTHQDDFLSGKLHHSLQKRVADIAFNDPFYPEQWHLDNKNGMDINVTGVWQRNITGKGVTVAVVDDGLEWTNPDLKLNYNHRGSWDMNDDDPDPTPSTKKASNHHGTRCAGEIAAVANNEICAVGVAYGAQIAGLRVLDGDMTDSMEAEAFNKKMEINDIYSCSWGPDDDGRTVDGPHLMAAKAMKYGVDFGRQGFGSIFVVASGNGGMYQDNCNYDGYANSIYTLTIGAVDEEGGMPYYAEECASMLGVTFSSGTRERDIVTTDWTHGNPQGCTKKHTGTSAAAPLAAGMVALMLQARPCLTWRDIQYLVSLTAQKVDVEHSQWQKNGAGLFHSHKHGFGLLNSWRLVNAARVWDTVPWLTSYSYAAPKQEMLIPKQGNPALSIHHVVTADDIRGLGLFILENVQVTLSISHPYRGKIGVRLISPAGTFSVLAAPRPKDNSSDGFNDWTFTTVRCWGEIPMGNWTIQVADDDANLFGQGKVTKWRLTLFGTPMTSEEFAERRQKINAAMSGEFLTDNYTKPCPPDRKVQENYSPVSDRILKILILTGSFCLVMALYESFEYIYCYDDEKKETARQMRLTARARDMANSAIGGGNSDGDTTALSNGLQNLNTGGHNGNDNFGDDDDEEEEDDVFDISETSRLLSVERRDRNIGANVNTPEVIPLSTFSVEEIQPEAKSYTPCDDDSVEINPSQAHEARNGFQVEEGASGYLPSIPTDSVANLTPLESDILLSSDDR